MANHVSLFVHLVWSTDRRRPVVAPEIEADVHRLIGAKCAEMKCIAIAVGGMPDHVHLLAELHPTVAVADLAKGVKGSSSHAVNHVLRSDPTFRWQTGYGAFTIRRSDVPVVKAYVLRQKQHHALNRLSSALEHVPAGRNA